jgi:hypothetical protein
MAAKAAVVMRMRIMACRSDSGERTDRGRFLDLQVDVAALGVPAVVDRLVALVRLPLGSLGYENEANENA